MSLIPLWRSAFGDADGLPRRVPPCHSGSAKGDEVPDDVAAAAPRTAQLDAYAQKQWDVRLGLLCGAPLSVRPAFVR